MSLSSPGKKLRILVVWGASHFDEMLKDAFLDNPAYDFEIVSGDRSKAKSPHRASLGRLLSLRRRLKRGEFDLVLCSPVQNTPSLSRYRGGGTRFANALRFFTYKRGMLDAWWVPWLVARRSGGDVPLAVIDFLDTSFVLPKDFPLLQAATLYYKLNLYFWPRRSLMPLEALLGRRRVTPLVPKLRPMTNGVPRKLIPATVRPMAERDIDICFTGTIVPNRSKDDPDPFGDLTYNPIRREIYERCVKLKDRYRVFALDGLVPKEEYRELLQRSKLVVCTESFGCETYRHNDVAASGAIPLVNWLYSTNHLPFQPDVHAVYFSMIGDDFERVVARALADPAKLEEIARAARDLVVNHKERQIFGDHVIRETLAAGRSGKAIGQD
jgi:hypothetical protein